MELGIGEATYFNRLKDLEKAKIIIRETRGVYKFNNKWKAQLMVNRKTINLGRFKDKLNAVMVRWSAEVLHKFPDCTVNTSAYNYLNEGGYFNLTNQTF